MLFNGIVSQNLVKNGVAPRLFFNEETHKPALRLYPGSLLGAVWLQLAQAADQGHAVFQCQAPKCGKLRVKNPKCRSGRVYYCDDACKMRAQRRRNKARRLQEAGASVPAIAKALGVGRREVRDALGLK